MKVTCTPLLISISTLSTRVYDGVGADKSSASDDQKAPSSALRIFVCTSLSSDMPLCVIAAKYGFGLGSGTPPTHRPSQMCKTFPEAPCMKGKRKSGGKEPDIFIQCEIWIDHQLVRELFVGHSAHIAAIGSLGFQALHAARLRDVGRSDSAGARCPCRPPSLLFTLLPVVRLNFLLTSNLCELGA